jgi:hypothetical protein
MNNEELIAAITELKEIVKASNRQLNGRMSEMENRMAELSGSVAIVLNRSAENKKETAEHKKKLATWQITVSNLTGVSRSLKKLKSTLPQKRIPES